MAEHFIEAHYYASGLRHQAFGVSRRPSWAPAEDSVGFQDEFLLDEGDGAVELRRFELGSDRVTWLGVYYRSVDAKLGDRQNHAGVGVWLRNGVVIDVADLLYGLSNLASFLAKNVDIDTLGAHVAKFSEANYLPAYVRTDDAYEFTKGVPFGPASMVDTQQYFASCAAGIGECRALSDYVLNLMLYASDDSLCPRSLILVSAKDQPPTAGTRMIKIPKDFDAGAIITSHLPAAFASIIGRASAAETEAANLRARVMTLEGEAQSLRAEHGELVSLRDDPWNIVLRRLDELSARLDAMGGSQRPPVQSYIPVMQKRHPVTSSMTSNPPQEEMGIDWLTLITVIVVIAVVLFALVFAIDRIVRVF